MSLAERVSYRDPVVPTVMVPSEDLQTRNQLVFQISFQDFVDLIWLSIVFSPLGYYDIFTEVNTLKPTVISSD